MKLEFKKWLEMVGTGVVWGSGAGPHPKHRDFNVWGAPGGVAAPSTSVKEGPIKPKKQKKK